MTHAPIRNDLATLKNGFRNHMDKHMHPFWRSDLTRWFDTSISEDSIRVCDGLVTIKRIWYAIEVNCILTYR